MRIVSLLRWLPCCCSTSEISTGVASPRIDKAHELRSSRSVATQFGANRRRCVQWAVNWSCTLEQGLVPSRYYPAVCVYLSARTAPVGGEVKSLTRSKCFPDLEVRSNFLEAIYQASMLLRSTARVSNPVRNVPEI